MTSIIIAYKNWKSKGKKAEIFWNKTGSRPEQKRKKTGSKAERKRKKLEVKRNRSGKKRNLNIRAVAICPITPNGRCLCRCGQCPRAFVLPDFRNETLRGLFCQGKRGHAYLSSTERYAQLTQRTLDKHIREWR